MGGGTGEVNQTIQLLPCTAHLRLTRWAQSNHRHPLKAETCLQYFGHLMRRVDSLEKSLMLGRNCGQEEKGTTEDEMAGWHHRLDRCEFEWTPGVGDGQGGLACCDSWGRKQLDTTERLNWTEPLSVINHAEWAHYVEWATRILCEPSLRNNVQR